jgi:AcrR family transcriptional regulator
MSDKTRRKIITAATRLFTQQGYARVTTRAIADEAQVNEVTLFRHFGNKKNVFIACIENFTAQGFASNFEQHLTGDFETDITHMARAQIQDMVENYAVIRMVMRDAQEVPEIKAAILDITARNAARITAYFHDQIKAGAIRNDLDPAILAHAFDSLFSSYVLFSTIFGEHDQRQPPPEPVIQQLVSLFIYGTLNP